MVIRVKIQREDFDLQAETRSLAGISSAVGGVNTFIGVVRDINDNDNVSSLFLEHYPGMTEKQIKVIVAEACDRWDVIAATVIHRIGELHPGDQIVYVGVASSHRGDAFDACEYIIDYLKTRATFWKKEKTTDGERWLETRQSDFDAAQLWNDK
ncbi:MAG: molybdopterin synthase catalytic subunit MoaE [bacterium]|nr:molybdopterin synthase catalytic subunit MoaE [Gammaproteobacteria bacterium]HIL96824.1 molybdopterin synthase catalytic subunit MoaE [Pseudomonadales bacterium]